MNLEPRTRVVMVDGIPMSALAIQVPHPRAVVLAVHGGGVTARYFDCPGNPRLSLMRAAASRGYTVVALDRPGYGASALYQEEMTVASRRTQLALGAVDAIVDGDGGRGLFVMAHSSGCDLGLRIAGDDSRDDVFGVELAGTGLRFAPGVRAAIGQATATSRPAGLRDLLWQPTESYPAEVLSGQLSAPGAAYEADVTSHWADRDFLATAALVTVPVQFSVAEYERVWEATPEALARIVALFTRSPNVTVNEMVGSGHNLSVGLTAMEYHQQVLSFADRCVSNIDQEEAP